MILKSFSSIIFSQNLVLINDYLIICFLFHMNNFSFVQRNFEVQICPFYCIDNSSTRSLNIWTYLLILHRCKNLRKDQTAKLVMSVTVYFVATGTICYSLLRWTQIVMLRICPFFKWIEPSQSEKHKLNKIELFLHLIYLCFFSLCALNIYWGIMRFSLGHRTTTTQLQLLPYFAEMNREKKKIMLYQAVAKIYIFNSKLGHCDIQKQWCLQVFLDYNILF